MKKLLYTSAFAFIALLMSKPVAAQQADTLKKEQVAKQQQTAFFHKTLAVTQNKAEQLAEIQQDYKTALGKIVVQPGLTETQRRLAIDALIDEKNRKLASLLSPEQLIKIVPTSELDKAKSAKDEQKKSN